MAWLARRVGFGVRPGLLDDWVDLGVNRRTLAIAPPFDLDAVATIGARLNA